MRVYLRRFLGRNVEFVLVVELHASGIAHLHVLLDSYIPQRWLSQAWQAVGGGKIVDIRWVDVHRTSAYLSKYLTDLSLVKIPAGTRRFSSSKGIALWPKKPERSGWWLSDRSIDELRERARQVYQENWESGEAGFPMLAFFSSEFLIEAALYSYRTKRTPGADPLISIEAHSNE